MSDANCSVRAGARLLLSGPGIFAAEAAAAVRDDVQLVSSLSFLLVGGFLFWRYRSPMMLTVVAVPLGAGTLAGLAVVGAVFGHVHGAALGFGMTMLGVVDYYPILLVTNLLTEGQGMWNFTAGDAVRQIEERLGRPIDVVVVNTSRPSVETLARYLEEHKQPLELGDVPPSCEVVTGEFWCRDIARHDRRRLAYAVWAVLAKRLL